MTEPHKPPAHFLDLDSLDTATLRRMLDGGEAYRQRRSGGEKPLSGKILALIFEKPSTRTRVSFEVGMRQLGGDVVVLNADSTQIGRGESIADTARVLSRYVDGIVIRTGEVRNLLDLAANATVPVINGLTDDTHPCQVMADLMTFEQHRGPLAGKVIAWCGDGNNVAASWIHAAGHFGFEMRLACPPTLNPSATAVAWARNRGARIEILEDPIAAVEGADCVVTDTWVSMGCQGDAETRRQLLMPYQVNCSLLARARPDVLFMHCLPAHRGEEVSSEVMDGPHSVVWDEAENRLHVQKSILAWCMR